MNIEEKVLSSVSEYLHVYDEIGRMLTTLKNVFQKDSMPGVHVEEFITRLGQLFKEVQVKETKVPERFKLTESIKKHREVFNTLIIEEELT